MLPENTRLAARAAGETTVTRLRQAGLRPTRKRLCLASLLFNRQPRYLTADMLHAEAIQNGIQVSLATVYSTLHRLAQSGLLQQVVIDPTRSYFHTDTERRQHVFDEDRKTLLDDADAHVVLDGAPRLPDGLTLSRIDVVVRVRQSNSSA